VLAPFGGYTGAATLSCSSPVTYVACTPASSALNFSSGNAQDISATVNVATTIASQDHRERNLTRLAAVSLLTLLFIPRRRRLTFATLATAMIFFTGCGSGTTASSGSSTPSQPAPSGSQTVTFTVTAAGISQTSAVTVNFQ